MSDPSKDYLEMIKKHVDPEACINTDGDVVYIDQHVITVSPDECKQIMNEICGIDGEIESGWLEGESNAD